MLKILALVGIVSLWAQMCSQRNSSVTNAEVLETVPSKIDTSNTVAVSFDADIKPILQAHCQPCHFTGGKMYARMPFDQPKTIRDHKEGIFRRIKDPEELKKLTAFLKSAG